MSGQSVNRSKTARPTTGLSRIVKAIGVVVVKPLYIVRTLHFAKIRYYDSKGACGAYSLSVPLTGQLYRRTLYIRISKIESQKRRNVGNSKSVEHSRCVLKIAGHVQIIDMFATVHLAHYYLGQANSVKRSRGKIYQNSGFYCLSFHVLHSLASTDTRACI